jgi:hypothetical protein
MLFWHMPGVSEEKPSKTQDSQRLRPRFDQAHSEYDSIVEDGILLHEHSYYRVAEQFLECFM